MSAPAEPELAIRAGCAGVAPLSGRLEPWQTSLLADPTRLIELIDQHGSPVNLLDPGPMARNAAELSSVANGLGVDLQILFARKANKALTFVDAARELGLGIDLASEAELRQVLERGISGEQLMMTAAVKPAPLLALCLQSGVTIAIDNKDELELAATLSASLDLPGAIAMRLAPELGPGRAQTRFGLEPAAVLDALVGIGGSGSRLTVNGIHFHLDGYDASDRVLALKQSFELADALRARGDHVRFVDMGGGVPMSYLDDESQWHSFWAEYSRALSRERDELTFDGQELAKLYPYHQAPVRGEWLEQVLNSPCVSHGTIAGELRARGLQLRCEPGRSLVDGCGMTIARVEFRKQRRDGTWLVGLAMNRTQCRSTSDDFMVDPILVRTGTPADEADEIEGYLVGAYCIERELITLRRMRFPNGVAVGDLVAFPNTAGYLMHILESSSHQIPLAQNVVVQGPHERLDDIDAQA